MHGAHHWVSSLAANLGTPRLSSHETYRRFVSVTGKPGGGSTRVSTSQGWTSCSPASLPPPEGYCKLKPAHRRTARWRKQVTFHVEQSFHSAARFQNVHTGAQPGTPATNRAVAVVQGWTDPQGKNLRNFAKKCKFVQVFAKVCNIIPQNRLCQGCGFLRNRSALSENPDKFCDLRSVMANKFIWKRDKIANQN